MKTATISELRINTDKLVRASALEKILITDRGQPVAILESAQGADSIGRPFPKRDIRKMPKVKGDSTLSISDERDAR